MANGNFSDSGSNLDSNYESDSENSHSDRDAMSEDKLFGYALPSVGLVTMFRLGLFQMALGMMSVLTLGVLNRIMIDELKVPALITALAIAAHQFVSPVRLWFGQMSDSKKVFGYHRTGFIWLGAILFAVAAFLAVQVIWQVGTGWQTGNASFATWLWIILLGGVFALYGIALSMSSTPFAALLVDISEENNRSKIVGVVWSMLMVGIIAGAILSSSILKQIALDAPINAIQSQVNRLFLIVPSLAIALAVIGTYGIEAKYSRFYQRSNNNTANTSEREDQITFAKAMKVLASNRQTSIFFCFLFLMSLSLFMQDAVMEPYGGEVFKMTIAETTRLNAFFGTGTLLGLGFTGFLIVPRLGKRNTTKYGCIAIAFCLLFFIAAGFTANPNSLKLALTFFGFASGVTTTGALSLMLDLTATETAGTFIGAWGLAQTIARASATVAGGGVLSIGKSLITNNPVLSYSLVFATQVVIMVVAISFLVRVNISEFQRNAKEAIATILQNEFD